MEERSMRRLVSTLCLLALFIAGAFTIDSGHFYAHSPAPQGHTNLTSSAWATSSSTYSWQFSEYNVLNGNQRGVNWGNGGGWNDATFNAWPDWIEVDWGSTQSIAEIDVFTI